MMPFEVAGAATPAIAAGEWRLVASDCTAHFNVRDKLVTTVHGSLPVVGGSVHASADGGLERARIELDAAGVATGNRRRDQSLLGRPFLDAVDHPLVVVEAGPVLRSTAGWPIEATLSARGRSAPVTLLALPTEVSATRVRATVTGTLDRSGLGMRVPSFIVGRYLELEVDMVFERQPEGEGEERD
ncbi:MAG: YceI family protein [Humibacillus sp.]|nr:YceI family protein [Humibacillus sp.]MDN5777009.1 YceI family protein [Humibacillus sp.]